MLGLDLRNTPFSSYDPRTSYCQAGFIKQDKNKVKTGPPEVIFSHSSYNPFTWEGTNEY